MFFHGNPTSFFIWRNIIPDIKHKVRCIAYMEAVVKPFRWAEQNRTSQCHAQTDRRRGAHRTVIGVFGRGQKHHPRTPDRLGQKSRP